MSELFIGLMSGTSLDGVDAVLVDLGDGAVRLLAHQHDPFPAALREELLSLNSPGDNELHRAALAANALARSYADSVTKLLEKSGQRKQDIRALGAHGQTVRHRPTEFDGCGYTSQLLNGSLLAEQSGVAVVCDLRSRDLAAGGQGAPLVPAFHRAVFGRSDADVAVLNIGGISNLSLLSQDGKSLGFDCGPGNCLMDGWIALHFQKDFDADGAWAASGRVLPELLARLLAEPYFQQPPPRSTGRDLFNSAWLARALRGDEAAADVQATLLELTAQSIVGSLTPSQRSGELLVCGGGALNGQLMHRLQALLPQMQVLTSNARGVPVMQVEAAAFAWLAQRFVHGLPGNLPQVTGAAGPRILGALYPA
ncbi:anhydro-N-acetylmuramic acid kinase [Paucibacter oligotrophus]|uniref:Anhydro-N-acetylmuramic acid kinase n=1 Tax=Roseateles oligotrophus TaxID=1769250 RepID=A0A840L980_9BURK|nr:anhydro-N-acetylmuramic acid kinase [Roseateles oligotrophus]MBB4844730.1 anhydro-N-acetylmuramic acid kinase [Roseateles oligotrophus]